MASSRRTIPQKAAAFRECWTSRGNIRSTHGGAGRDRVRESIRGRQELVNRRVQVKGVTDDLYARTPDDVSRRLLVAARVNQVASAEAEDRAVGEHLVKVGVGVAPRLFRLVYNGYVQLVPRLIGQAAAVLPLPQVPRVDALSGALIVGLACTGRR